MSHNSGKKKAAGPKFVTNEHGVKFMGVTSSASTPVRVTRSNAAMASNQPSGPSSRTLGSRIKTSVTKKKNKKGEASPIVSLSDDSAANPSDDQPKIIQDEQVDQVVENYLEKLANAAEDEKVETANEETPSVEISVQKTPISSSQKETKRMVSEEEDDSGDEILIKKTTTSVTKAPRSASKKDAERRSKKKEDPMHKTPKMYKSSQVQIPEKKKKKEKKIEPSPGRKRKHVSDSDSEPDVRQDVPDISTTARKRMKGKRIPVNVPNAPVDNVSFHFLDSAQRWKYVVQRRLAIERELHEDALELKEIMEVLSTAGLMKTVKDLGRCFDKLVREFIMNIPVACDDATSAEYRKQKPCCCGSGEPDFNRVATTLTGKLVRKWPKKGLLRYGRLTAKYDVFYKIGTANWMATNHLYGVIPPLARMLYLVGTGGEFDFGKLIFEQTLKPAGSYVVKLPILFPCLLSEIIAHQQPTIVRADESQGKKPLPLMFDYRLFAGTHVPDNVLSAAKGTASASGTKAVGSSKEDILAELKAVSKSLGDTIQACKVRKFNVDQLIKTMSDVATAAAEEESEEEEP
ncbi:uncharacterized protein LOC130719309 [Lotus japonicus]|uniref:uncharacterized protein LOC130719309 n=1 Tax=Lotus japonicus TaxID=34305 RepID=UPI00258CF9CB|nr:uncharacterized protein LOC130719309 [Lotus japonicus]